MAKIAILIGSHLSTCPRSVKEADALSKAGHDVTVFGNWTEDDTIKFDQILLETKPWKFVPGIDSYSSPISAKCRIKSNSFFRRLSKTTKCPCPHLFGYSPYETLNRVKKIKPELVIAHYQAGLWILTRLPEGIVKAVDFEDWFSRGAIYADGSDFEIKYLEELEQEALDISSYAVTTSDALAVEISDAYGSKRPEVIYNCFPLGEKRKVSKENRNSAIRLFWFSQTIGPGRGLENLMKALALVTSPVYLGLLSFIAEDYKKHLVLN